MGLSVRRETDAIALALVKAHNDSRQAVGGSITAWGAVTLVLGTKTVTQAGLTASSMVTVTKTAHVGGPGGSQLTIVPSAGQFIITAVDTSGSVVVADLSTFNWKAETPVFHADQTSSGPSGDYQQPAVANLTVTAAAATDLPTSITLANQMRQVLNQSMADTTAHLAADVTNPITAAVCVDLATANTLANAIKTALNAHIALAASHLNVDTANTNSTTAATTLGTLQTLLNALKTNVNAHLASAPTGESVALISA